MRKAIGISLLFLFSFQGYCEGSSPEEKNWRLRALPGAYFTPETNWGFGALGLLTFRTPGQSKELFPSQLGFGLSYTLNKQILAYLPFDFYFHSRDLLLKGELGYYIFGYDYFGKGNQHEAENREFYKVRFPRLRLDLMEAFSENVSFGLRYWFQDFQIDSLSQSLMGELGSEGSRDSELGAVFRFDSRDHLFWPSKGHLFDFSFQVADEFIGSSHPFQRLAIDYSTFIPLGFSREDDFFGKHTLGLNAYFEALNGRVPFNRLALLGGTKKMRGFVEGTFRDNTMMELQMEYRSPSLGAGGLLQRFRLTAFAGIGGVGSDLNDLFSESWKNSYGAGLRLLLDKKEGVYFRFDYAFASHEQSGLYLTVGEAF